MVLVAVNVNSVFQPLQHGQAGWSEYNSAGTVNMQMYRSARIEAGQSSPVVKYLLVCAYALLKVKHTP